MTNQSTFGIPIAMIDIEEFVPDLMSEVAYCPVPVLERRLREVVVEACERVNLVRWQASEVPTEIDRIAYDIPTPSTQLAVHSIIRCYLNQTPLRNVPLIETQDNIYNQIDSNESGYFVPNRGQIQLTGTPSEASSPLTDDPRTVRGLDLFVSLKPTRNCDELPKILYDDYYNLVISGTLARLFGMNDTDWHDASKEERRQREFEFEIARAKQQLDRGFTTKPLKLRPRRFV